MKKYSVFFLLVSILFFSCTEKSEQTYALIETRLGNMKILLNEKTVKHTENFITLAEKGFYDSLLFHRVIKDFMIQGGDPDSKFAKQGDFLGNGDIGYEIEPEFFEDLFHKKGVLAAAREPDISNPLKKSSGSQFYIVQGKKWTEKELDDIENKVITSKRSSRINNFIYSDMNLMKKVDSLQKNEYFTQLDSLYESIGKKIDDEFKNENKFKISADHRKVYKEVGGTPFLDQEYTIFGEVVEGLDVIDKIAELKVDSNDRPIDDLRMKISIIRKK